LKSPLFTLKQLVNCSLCLAVPELARSIHANPQMLERIVNEYERWQDRFSGQDYAFGKEPNYFLKSCKQLLPRSGWALAVADGEGRNGVWLAEQGLDVLSIDFSPLAQAKARALAIEMRVSVNFEIADVHRWNYPEAEFDVVVEIFTQFSSPNERTSKMDRYAPNAEARRIIDPPRVHAQAD
jgi:ubiquinone/menaquinone biosynthesis C-methylase UbiE